MSGASERDQARQDLSALMDGGGGRDDVARACAAWRSDEDARATWHAYHVIGDVLRSDDLATSASHDEQFLAKLRKRLADEPVVLAPSRAAPVRPARVRRRWLAPAAVAAGFLSVAGVLVVLQMPAGLDDPRLAGSTPAVAGGNGLVPVRADAVQAPPSVPPTALPVATQGPLVRDPELQRYLAAHGQYTQPYNPEGSLLQVNAQAHGR